MQHYRIIYVPTVLPFYIEHYRVTYLQQHLHVNSATAQYLYIYSTTEQSTCSTTFIYTALPALYPEHLLTNHSTTGQSYISFFICTTLPRNIITAKLLSVPHKLPQYYKVHHVLHTPSSSSTSNEIWIKSFQLGRQLVKIYRQLINEKAHQALQFDFSNCMRMKTCLPLTHTQLHACT